MHLTSVRFYEMDVTKYVKKRGKLENIKKLKYVYFSF